MTIEDHATETWALEYALAGNFDNARITISHLAADELDRLNDALDQLAVIVDSEAIRRAERREIHPEPPRTRATKRRPPFN